MRFPIRPNVDASGPNIIAFVVGLITLAIAWLHLPAGDPLEEPLYLLAAGLLLPAGTMVVRSPAGIGALFQRGVAYIYDELDADDDGRVSAEEMREARGTMVQLIRWVRRWMGAALVLLVATTLLLGCGGPISPPDGGLYLEVAAYEVDTGEAIAGATYDCALTWQVDDERYEWTCDNGVEAGIGVRIIAQSWVLTPGGAAELWVNLDGRAVEGAGVAMSSDGCAVFGDIRECWRVAR